jgi:HEPN domain-containing protein
MTSDPAEWLRQAEYDMETAGVLMKEKRYIYVVFMSHLSIEKALKGLFVKKFSEEPPKTHSLIHMAETLKLHLPEHLNECIFLLNRVSVPARYPSDLQSLIDTYDDAKTRPLFVAAGEVLAWLKKKY